MLERQGQRKSRCEVRLLGPRQLAALDQTWSSVYDRSTVCRAARTSPRRNVSAPVAIAVMRTGSSEMSNGSPMYGLWPGSRFGSKVYMMIASQS